MDQDVTHAAGSKCHPSIRLHKVTADRTLVCAWLFNSNGGGIAYFGEFLVCEDDKGREFESDMFAAFKNLSTSRLGTGAATS
jgi:hypothetical protein